jgi:hypothetical protein
MAFVRCRLCGERVGLLYRPLVEIEDDPTHGVAWAGGVVFRGTRKTTDQRVQVAQMFAKRAGTPVQDLPRDDQYLVVLQTGTPASLPTFCSDCGPCTVSTRALMGAAATADATGDAPTIHVPTKGHR